MKWQCSSYCLCCFRNCVVSYLHGVSIDTHPVHGHVLDIILIWGGGGGVRSNAADTAREVLLFNRCGPSKTSESG